MRLDELLNVMRSSKKYDLEQIRYPNMPAFDPVKPGLLYFLYRHHESYYNPDHDGPRTSASGLIIMSDQTGTHIDALCHQASDLKLSVGVKVTPEIETPWGFTKGGAEELPLIVARGVLIDVASVYQDPLPENSMISLEQVKKTLEVQGTTVERGDVVLVRTGYGKYWNDEEKYRRAAGVSKEVSSWLARTGPVAVGSDNLAWDLPSFKDPETHSSLPGHLLLIAERGIPIIENVRLEELAKDKVYQFLLIGFPLKFKGATGTPLRPVAIVP
ncbi:cyclase [Sulfodiicoccus acidiphilus]|uniref:Cyclase n=1 Tax=Sulfodiicoccus acidiphilus TaxID=1670455 RepID=A0A348B1V6_9CREN|nr:cyclase family protein [Sulfodiicoccus acidiphilus]BBD72158.1 cyclase [Sulfodiicoccus acidiphilus]GGT94587.1 cyclase [Sulfodiicoccus acidiphilus]